MKSFRCGDVVAACTTPFVGTEDEAPARVAGHARQAHELAHELAHDLAEDLARVAPGLVARVPVPPA